MVLGIGSKREINALLDALDSEDENSHPDKTISRQTSCQKGKQGDVDVDIV